MNAVLDAVYEDGVFKPAAPPALADGAHVRLTFERVSGETPDYILRLATGVYAGLAPEDIDDVERHARRRALFGERQP